MYFLTQIKRTKGTIEKGCVVKETLDAARQSYHAYLGAYAYGHDINTDYVQCLVTNMRGGIELSETWDNITAGGEETSNEEI